MPLIRADVDEYTDMMIDYLRHISYRYEPTVFPGKITVILSEAETKRRFLSPSRGWDRVAGGGLDLEIITGDHFSVLTPPGVEALASVLTSRLAPIETSRS